MSDPSPTPFSARPRFRPPFSASRIVVSGNHVEHWLNGEKVVEYELGSETVLAKVARSKFKNIAGFGTKLKTALLLQDHGIAVWFRNIRVRELTVKPPAAKK